MFETVENCGIGKFVSYGEWIHPDRVIDSYEIILVTKGEVYIKEDGVEYHLLPDDVLVLHPNRRHMGYKSSTDTEFFWMHWRGEATLCDGGKCRKIEDTYTILLYLRQLLNARIMQKGAEYINYLTRLVLLEVSLSSSNTNIANPTAEKVAAWIKANCTRGITDTATADYFGYNVDYLNRLFKSCFKKTIKQYINEKRIEFIKALMLTENLPLKEIAARAGFSEYKYFLKFFKYHEKTTPKNFYKEHAYVYINSR